MKDRIILVIKGLAMGFADVIPGVSGGTMALLLGIYTKLIHAIKSVDLRFVKPLWRVIRGGFKAEDRAELGTVLRAMHLPWLMTLGFGIVMAFGIGSKVIPTLMERYPEIMMGFFFGLVLASVSAPIRIMDRFGLREGVIILVATVGTYLLVGASVTPPLEYREFVAEKVHDGGQTLKELAEAGPSALPPEGMYWDANNASLRDAIASGPSDVSELARGINPKSHTNPYNDLIVPAGTLVNVPAPAPWFIFIAGFIAICAMVLPGVSGSFLLLVMGSYYFMLNALKGFIRRAAHVVFPESQFVYVVLFSLGALLGLVVFSRLLSWLLERAPTATMAVLVGLMVGCLRVIWPFKERLADGSLGNIMPNPAAYGATLWMTATAALLGLGIVVALTVLARQKAEA